MDPELLILLSKIELKVLHSGDPFGSLATCIE